jgi:hypothetical protein
LDAVSLRTEARIKMTKLKNIENIHPKIWSKLHKIDVVTHPCEKCGVLYTADIPIETHNMVGFIAPLHECGPQYRLAFYAYKSSKKREAHKKMFNDLVGRYD